MTRWVKCFDAPPMGEEVLVVRDNGTIWQAVIQSEPWTLGSGDVVIKVEGITGCYSLDRIYVRHG